MPVTGSPTVSIATAEAEVRINPDDLELCTEQLGSPFQNKTKLAGASARLLGSSEKLKQFEQK